LLASLKLETWAALRAKGWRKADLARAMCVNPRQIDRLLDLQHATPVAQLEAALALCDRRIDIISLAA
jgi:antitoxin HicB